MRRAPQRLCTDCRPLQRRESLRRCRLYAVTVAGGRARLHALGDAAGVDKELESLRFSLRSLAMARQGSRAAESP